MDPSLIAAEEPAGLYGWIMQYGSVVAFIAQIVYWLALVILLAYAVWQFKRWVNFQLGVGRSGKLRTDVLADDEKAVAVDEFVD